jgi:hypothetical protein
MLLPARKVCFSLPSPKACSCGSTVNSNHGKRSGVHIRKQAGPCGVCTKGTRCCRIYHAASLSDKPIGEYGGWQVPCADCGLCPT